MVPNILSKAYQSVIPGELKVADETECRHSTGNPWQSEKEIICIADLGDGKARWVAGESIHPRATEKKTGIGRRTDERGG